ncbi:TetR/AcrR family transcriptional regulator [Nakamurella alba]|uniref:TetR/AcrR family transcriptional regulator n=1 Tax=Nakamurella alba TaxID=2665158 RepID=UPI0018AAB4D7|nr:TetR/AcrR family transcriptional regulator [Nakamurella alba]
MTAQPRVSNPRGSGLRLRSELISAARDLLMRPADGPPFSLRAVARAAGVSPTAVYQHFPSLPDLVTAVVQDRSDQLSAAVGAPDGPPTAEALADHALRYLEWGVANPGAYQLLFESAERLGHPVGPGTPGWSMIDDLTDWIRPVAGEDAPARAIRAWTQLHGVASLRIHKPDLPWPTGLEVEAARIARQTLAD